MTMIRNRVDMGNILDKYLKLCSCLSLRVTLTCPVTCYQILPGFWLNMWLNKINTVKIELSATHFISYFQYSLFKSH